MVPQSPGASSEALGGSMADSQIDTNRLIDALMAQWSSEGMDTEHLRQTTQKIISAMPDIWRFRVGKLMDKIRMQLSPLPSHMTLEQQGVFILGYYHQTQKRYEKKEEK